MVSCIKSLEVFGLINARFSMLRVRGSCNHKLIVRSAKTWIVITRGGKIVVSRSFREIQRSRVEALLASFPKLASSGSGSQHTVVEANSVRYVWQNLYVTHPAQGVRCMVLTGSRDEFYLVLITNVGSNSKVTSTVHTRHLTDKLQSSKTSTLSISTLRSSQVYAARPSTNGKSLSMHSNYVWLSYNACNFSNLRP